MHSNLPYLMKKLAKALIVENYCTSFKTQGNDTEGETNIKYRCLIKNTFLRTNSSAVT